MIKGKVKSYSDFNGYGFIAGEDGIDYFAHVSKIVGTDERTLDVGDNVVFIPCKNAKGGYAAEIRVVSHAKTVNAPSVLKLKKNPFTPQMPITDASKFAGRREAIFSAIDAMFNNKNILISGPRGIGKSSLAYQLLYLTSGENDLLVRCGITETDLFNNIICDYRCMPGNTITDIAAGLISSLCDKLNIELDAGKSTTYGIDLTIFNASHTDEYQPQALADTLASFTHQIEKIFSENNAVHNGITFLIDEIDTLDAETPVAAFLKGAVEKFALDSYTSFYFLISGITGTVTNMIAQHPSVSRLFENIALSPLTDEELQELISSHLMGTGVTSTENAIGQIISFSNNFPHPVQLIGYYAFRFDTDGILDEQDIDKSVKYIVQNLKQQEFETKFGKLCAGKNVEILRTMVSSKFPSVSITYLAQNTGLEYQEVAGILGGLIQEGVVEKSFRNQYRFVEPMFPIYLKMIFDIG